MDIFTYHWHFSYDFLVQHVVQLAFLYSEFVLQLIGLGNFHIEIEFVRSMDLH